MKTSTAYNHFTRLKNRLDSIHSSARQSGPTHKELTAQVSAEIWQDPGFKRLPHYWQAMLHERSGLHFEQIQRDCVIWLFPQPDGTALGWDEQPEEVRKSYCSADKAGVHYWILPIWKTGGKTSVSDNRTGGKVVREYQITSRVW